MKKLVLKTIFRLAGYKMLNDEEKQVLNNVEVKESEGLMEVSREPIYLSKRLHKNILKLKSEYLNTDVGKTNFVALGKDEKFVMFERETTLLKETDLNSLDETGRKAFFLNIYNTLTIHSLSRNVNVKTKTLLNLNNFWTKSSYNIGGNILSLDDIEHGVLRCNKLHPAYQQCLIPIDGKKSALILKSLDPRIHFALNCGAKSCPPIRLFTEANLERGLELAATTFCTETTVVDTNSKTITVSKILDWYKEDFGKTESDVIRFVKKYLSEEQKKALEGINNPKLKYSCYDWSV